MNIPKTKIVQLYQEYVPTHGIANTLGGEILRATSKIDYRYFNDGDKIGIDEGNENCNSPARFIKSKVPNSKSLIDRLWGEYDSFTYEECLDELALFITNYLETNDKVFEIKNTQNSITDFIIKSDNDYDLSYIDLYHYDIDKGELE